MNTRRVASSAIAIVVVILVGLVGYKYGTKKVVIENSDANAKQAAVGFVNALVDGDVDKTYSLGSTAYQAKNTKDHVKSVSDTLKSDDPEFSDEEIFFGKDQTTNQALYLASVSNLPSNAYGRTTGNFVIRLVVQDGAWKVDSSQVY